MRLVCITVRKAITENVSMQHMGKIYSYTSDILSFLTYVGYGVVDTSAFAMHHAILFTGCNCFSNLRLRSQLHNYKPLVLLTRW